MHPATWLAMLSIYFIPLNTMFTVTVYHVPQNCKFVFITMKLVLFQAFVDYSQPKEKNYNYNDIYSGAYLANRLGYMI